RGRDVVIHLELEDHVHRLLADRLGERANGDGHVHGDLTQTTDRARRFRLLQMGPRLAVARFVIEAGQEDLATAAFLFAALAGLLPLAPLLGGVGGAWHGTRATVAAPPVFVVVGHGGRRSGRRRRGPTGRRLRLPLQLLTGRLELRGRRRRFLAGELGHHLRR